MIHAVYDVFKQRLWDRVPGRKPNNTEKTGQR